MTRFKAACVQLRSGQTVADNIAAAETLIREAAALGAHYVQTPEMTNLLVRSRADLAERITGEQDDATLTRFRTLAEELGIYLHAGSLAIKAGDKAANRAYLIAPDGRIIVRYDKIHMFDVDLPGGESWRESETYAAGGESPVVPLPWLTMGVAICYDVRFPAIFRSQARAGAAMLTMPAAFTRQTGEAHWHVLQRARAIENGAWVVSAAQGGRHEDGRQTYGYSLIVDPWGRVVAELEGEEPGVIVAEIDPAQSADARRRIPAIANERDFEITTAAGQAARELAE